MDAPAVAVSDDGKKFAVGWMGSPDKDRDAFWSMSGAADVRLPDDAKGVQGHPSMGVDASGIFHVVWEDARSGKTSIYMTCSAPGAKNERLAEDASYPSLSAGKFVGVVWEHSGNAEFRKVK
jgi:hypothetical protein